MERLIETNYLKALTLTAFDELNKGTPVGAKKTLLQIFKALHERENAILLDLQSKPKVPKGMCVPQTAYPAHQPECMCESCLLEEPSDA